MLYYEVMRKTEIVDIYKRTVLKVSLDTNKVINNIHI